MICCPILKYLLIRPLALVLFWEFQILIYITAISNLEEALMIQEHDTRITSLKIWVSFITFSIISDIIGEFVLTI